MQLTFELVLVCALWHIIELNFQFLLFEESYIDSYSVFVIPSATNNPAMKAAILYQTEPTESVYADIPLSSTSTVQQTDTKLTPSTYQYYVTVGPLSL